MRWRPSLQERLHWPYMFARHAGNLADNPTPVGSVASLQCDTCQVCYNCRVSCFLLLTLQPPQNSMHLHRYRQLSSFNISDKLNKIGRQDTKFNAMKHIERWGRSTTPGLIH